MYLYNENDFVVNETHCEIKRPEEIYENLSSIFALHSLSGDDFYLTFSVNGIIYDSRNAEKEFVILNEKIENSKSLTLKRGSLTIECDVNWIKNIHKERINLLTVCA